MNVYISQSASSPSIQTPPNTHHARSQVMDANLGRVDTINQDPSLHRIHKSQNTHGQRRLATARPSQETYPFPGSKLEGNVLQHWRKLRGILDYQIFDADQRVRARARGPVRRWTVRFDDGRRFLGEIEILDNTLDRADREKRWSNETTTAYRETYFRSSSRAVQNRHAQYTLIVNDIALVIQRPAVPAETYPDSANKVVINTARPPSVSKLSKSHRLVIQKLYHIYIFTRQLDAEWTRVRKYRPLSSHRS